MANDLAMHWSGTTLGSAGAGQRWSRSAKPDVPGVDLNRLMFLVSLPSP